MTAENPKSILICGESGHGKSASLMGLKDREDVLYLNCENGKPLPFKSKFKKKVITDPTDILDFLEQLYDMGETNPYNFVIIDTASFMMDMFERMHVINSANTQKAWGEYGQFFPKLMDATAKLENVFFIFLGHLDSQLDEEAGYMRHQVPVKGALSKKGLEAFFTTVVYVKRMRIKDILKELPNPSNNLNITPREEAKGFKHVIITDTDKAHIGGRIRTPMGMFDEDELYIDSDASLVLKRLVKYYSGD